MKIYTRTGDDGSTGLYGGRRVSKHDPQVEAYGAVDETNANLGVARTLGPSASTEEQLTLLQRDLFTVGAELACPPENHGKLGMDLIGARDIERLEGWIDELEGALPPLKSFVLPTGTPVAAELHRARTVCRRAERRVVELSQSGAVRSEVVIFLNRLSDLLFSMARAENHEQGRADEPWIARQR